MAKVKERSRKIDPKDVVKLLQEEGSISLLEGYVKTHPKFVIEYRDNLGWSILHHAVFSGDLKAVQYVILHNPPINAQDSLGMTPLHLSSHKNYIDISRFLVQNCEAELDIKTHSGDTPLEKALSKNSKGSHGEMITFLEAAMQPRIIPSINTLQHSNPNLSLIPAAELEIDFSKKLGSGGFSDVFYGIWWHSEVAVKRFHSEEDMSAVKKEVEMMSRCQSNYIVRVHGIFSGAMIVMEYFAGGSLYEVLHADKKIDWMPTRWNIAIDIAKGIDYLHNQNILHRDLKSPNIFLTSQLRAKIGDFGQAKQIIEHGININTVPNSDKKLSKRWSAPEILENDKVVPRSKKTDIYSYGIILWEIASRKTPYDDIHDEKVCSHIVSGGKNKNPPDCPYDDVIDACANPDSSKRPPISETLQALRDRFKQFKQSDEKSKERIWHIDPDTKDLALSELEKEQSPYVILDASPRDCMNAATYYLRNSVPGKSIASVKVVYNPDMEILFDRGMRQLSHRYGTKVFAPQWVVEDKHTELRKEVDTIRMSLSSVYPGSHYQGITLLPMWHGTSRGTLSSIFKTSFAPLSKTDPGFFGKGLYFAWEAEYAYNVYSDALNTNGVLLMTWVSYYSAYPTIYADQNKLSGKAAKTGYDAHFVPVVPRNPKNSHEVNFDALRPNQKQKYTEVVVFDNKQTLPRYIVELQDDAPKKLFSSYLSPHGFFHYSGIVLKEEDLLAASHYVYNNHLCKSYTNNSWLVDWTYSHSGHVIHRPNHGLAHTLRTASYVPFVVQYYIEHQSLQDEDAMALVNGIPWLQLVMLFFVSGRENDVGFHADNVLYGRFRQLSMDAFISYCVDEKHLGSGDEKVVHYSHALRDCYTTVSHINSIIAICHDLDLVRCYSPGEFEVKCNNIVNYVGYENMLKLKQLALNAVKHTGDRIMGCATEIRGYQGPLFVECSQNVNTCMNHIQQAVVEWNELQKVESAHAFIL